MRGVRFAQPYRERALSADRDLVDAVRALPRIASVVDLDALDVVAQGHGLDGVLADAWEATGLPLPTRFALRRLARMADHDGHLAMLTRIDNALVTAGLDAVALKGVLLGARIYRRPSSRPTTDIDLLVRLGDLSLAADALRVVGYSPSEAPGEARFLRRGHHAHLVHAAAPSLELHFHAYRGFGRALESDPLIDRSMSIDGYGRLRVLAPADEVVYLSVHAAAHRFERLGWLYDIALLMDAHAATGLLDGAAAHADAMGMALPFALALHQVEALIGKPVPSIARPLGWLRKRLLIAIAPQPRNRLLRAATRFAYSVALCQDCRAVRVYSRDAIADGLERLRIE